MKPREPIVLQKNADNSISWTAYIIEPGSDDRIFLHEDANGFSCRCFECLLSFHRLKLKLFPRTFTTQMFQSAPGYRVVLLNERGNVEGFAHPDVIFNTKFHGAMKLINPFTGEWNE